MVVLQRPQHPYLIIGVDGSGGFRVHGLQFCVHGLRADGFQFGGQLLAQTVRGFLGGEAHTVQKALHIQPGTTYQQRQMSPGGDILNILPCQRGKIRHTEGFFRGEDIHAVVRDAAGLLRGDLGSAHIQTFIDLHGVGADDLAGELLRQRNAQRGLAGGGGAYHSHHGGSCITRCVQTAFPTPFG